MKDLKKSALDYHIMNGKSGKIEVVPTKPCTTADELSLAYSPGVAHPVLEIDKNPEDVYRYTDKGNLVAVISNGSAILGLGNRGALASKPVMEGKGVLFKRFADIDVFDIELNTSDPQKIIEAVKLMEPTFGGINLEDIKAPECFEIEEVLDNELDIPVLHDDQHGTAVVVLAALINIAKYTYTNLSDESVGIIGLGAAGSGIQKLLFSYGVKTIYGFDLSKDMCDLFEKRGGIITDLENVVKKSKIVIATTGCPGLITKEMVQQGHIILALTNPNPEIEPDEAIEAGAVFAADGKSVNNALAFPGLFKGALNARAKRITDEMKIAAAETIAGFAEHEDLVPNILDLNVHEAVAKAVETAAYRSGAIK
jgi:malate dehydrogenase (oxaloacetate-decarboxylating)